MDAKPICSVPCGVYSMNTTSGNWDPLSQERCVLSLMYSKKEKTFILRCFEQESQKIHVNCPVPNKDAIQSANELFIYCTDPGTQETFGFHCVEPANASKILRAIAEPPPDSITSQPLPTEVALPDGSTVMLRALAVPVSEMVLSKADLAELKNEILAELDKRLEKMKTDIIAAVLAHQSAPE